MTNKLIVIFFILALTGCNTGQYQSYQSGVGYQSELTEESSYYVTYTGSSSTKIEKVNDFALLRCAELSLEKGYNYFVIIEADNNKEDLGGPEKSMNDFSDSGSSPYMGGTISGPRAKSELTIVLLNEKPEGIHYEAQTVLEALKSEYEILQ